MPIIGKERQEQPVSVEEQALEQVEGYIEQVEKRPEINGEIAGIVRPAPSLTQMPPVITDAQGRVVAKAVGEPEIELPLNESQVREGLHHKVIDSIRWLAEWCLMIIKKYPGRVFYSKAT